ncbi:MAG: Holliday junction branch migration DNA helicase RuvB, partial [Deltaproteobacteria bacterium]
MVREPVIRGDCGDRGGRDSNHGSGGDEDAPRDDDSRFHDELRPQMLADVVGQREVIERVRIMLNAARKRKEPLGHLLLDGPPGLGKTTFATVLPRELGT